MKTWLTKSKTHLPSENIPRKGEKLVTRENISRIGLFSSRLLAKAKMRFPSESVARKDGNAFAELIRLLYLEYIKQVCLVHVYSVTMRLGLGMAVW